MNNIKCIFDSTKACDDCGDCDRCDLDANKICDNCGKCIEPDNTDMRAVRVDEVIDDINEAKDFEDDLDALEDDLDLEGDANTAEKDEADTNEVWEYIDDIDGLNDILDDKDNFSKYAEEEFPGFIKIKKIH